MWAPIIGVLMLVEMVAFGACMARTVPVVALSFYVVSARALLATSIAF